MVVCGEEEDAARALAAIEALKPDLVIAEGLSNKEIAGQMGVGVRTVETHRERIMRKLNIHTVAGMTKYAISQGLITLSRQLTT